MTVLYFDIIHVSQDICVNIISASKDSGIFPTTFGN